MFSPEFPGRTLLGSPLNKPASPPYAPVPYRYAGVCRRDSENLECRKLVSEKNPSETVWKIRMGFTWGSQKSVKRGEKRPHYRFAPPKTPATDPYSYFPNSFSRDCLKNSLTRPLERQSTVTHPENRVNKARFSYSGSPLGLPLEIFQTVSLGSPVSEN